MRAAVILLVDILRGRPRGGWGRDSFPPPILFFAKGIEEVSDSCGVLLINSNAASLHAAHRTPDSFSALKARLLEGFWS